MKLKYLNIGSRPIKDISVVRDMPLTEIYNSGGSPDADLSPLANITSLVQINIPKGAKNVELLRSLPNVKRLGYGWDDKNQRIDHEYAAHSHAASRSTMKLTVVVAEPPILSVCTRRAPST